MAGMVTQVLDTLAEINERHEAVKELEKSLMELHQIFLDMAVLVEAQGEMLDNIEQQVSGLLRWCFLSWQTMVVICGQVVRVS